jgi:hypothetical protein
MLSGKEDVPTTSTDSRGRHDAGAAWNDLLDNRLPDGGFALHPGGEFRPDATAWAVIALALGGMARDKLASSCGRLAEVQQPDGRLALFPAHPDVVWPTAVAAIAWALAGERQKERARACDFLVRQSERRPPADPSAPARRTSSAHGWPWVLNSYSWVFPTACALIALDLSGRSGDARTGEAIAVLLDRQLKAGGWNYGNVESFGQALRPFPDITGVALSALAGHCSRDAVARSLEYLESEARRIRTPWSLGWALVGLSSWGNRPEGADLWVLEALARQQRLGRYDTNSLAVLLTASAAARGLRPVLAEHQR